MNTFDTIKAVLYNPHKSNYIIAERILKQSQERGIEVVEYSDDEDYKNKIASFHDVYKSKEVLILTEFKGRKFQQCPGSQNVICCNYYLLNTCFNCLYNCVYCFLNSYLNSYGIIQFINLDDLGSIIRDFAAGSNKSIIRVGTGEYTDSLMFDEVTGISSDLIAATSSLNNLFLEFKTKSDNIWHLKDIRNKGNTVLAWSLNTQRNIDLYEYGAAGLENRIRAAAAVQGWGYLTAFHFDPVIKYDNFLEEYCMVIDLMAQMLDPSRVVWISMGCFRYTPGFKDIVKYIFPDETLTLEEMFPGIDGKMRYLSHERTAIFSILKNKIENNFPDAFLYLCMEDSRMWRDVFNVTYNESADLEKDMGNHLYNKLLK